MFKEKELVTMTTEQLENYLRRTITRQAVIKTSGVMLPEYQPSYDTIRARAQVSEELAKRMIASPLVFGKNYS